MEPGNQAKRPSAEQLEFWRKRVREWYPELPTKHYFIPSCHFRNVPLHTELVASQQTLVIDSVTKGRAPHKTSSGGCSVSPSGSVPSQTVAGQPAEDSVTDKNVPNETPPARPADNYPPLPATVFPQVPASTNTEVPVYESDVKGETAEQHVFHCLQKLTSHIQEPMVILSQLKFGPNVKNPAYAAAATEFHMSPEMFKKHENGEFDFLIISKNHGLIIAEVKAIRNDCWKPTDPIGREQVQERVKKALKQIQKAKQVVARMLRTACRERELERVKITGTIILPYMKPEVLGDLMRSQEELKELACQVLGVGDIEGSMKRCICSAIHSDLTQPSEVPQELEAVWRDWWTTITETDPVMQTDDTYEFVVALFAGPATTVELPTLGRPRLSFRTEGETIAAVGWLFARLNLTLSQLDLLSSQERLVFLTGPPGTGKTVVLVLIGLIWMCQGHDVYILSTQLGNRAVSFLLREQIERCYQHYRQQLGADSSSPSSSCPKVYRRQYSFDDGSDSRANAAIKTTVSVLAARAERRDGELRVIVDDAANPMRPSTNTYTSRFRTFCTELFEQLPNLHLWAASIFNQNNIPGGWKEFQLQEPLRCPPVVIDEVKRSPHHDRSFPGYKVSSAPQPTDGPQVREIIHSRANGHDKVLHPKDCEECARRIAGMMRDFNIGSSGPNDLQFRDVIILCNEPIGSMGLVRGLLKRNVPVEVVTRHDDNADIRAMALAEDDTVIVTDWEVAAGLERRVVVVIGELGGNAYIRPYGMSRSTSQLIIVPTHYKHIEVQTNQALRKEAGVQISRSRMQTNQTVSVSVKTASDRWGKDDKSAERGSPKDIVKIISRLHTKTHAMDAEMMIHLNGQPYELSVEMQTDESGGGMETSQTVVVQTRAEEVETSGEDARNWGAEGRVRWRPGRSRGGGWVKTGQEVGVETGQESGVEMGQESGVEMGQESGVEMGRESGVEMGHESGVEMGQDSGVEMGQEVGMRTRDAEVQTSVKTCETGTQKDESDDGSGDGSGR